MGHVAQPLLLLAVLSAFISFAASLFILAHAFRRSVGTGVIVLFIPFYVLPYAFRQFEHPKKGAVVVLWLGGVLTSAVLFAAAQASGR